MQFPGTSILIGFLISAVSVMFMGSCDQTVRHEFAPPSPSASTQTSPDIAAAKSVTPAASADRHVVADPQWFFTAWHWQEQFPNAIFPRTQIIEGGRRFVVNTPRAWAIWESDLNPGIPLSEFPIVTMKYRATGIMSKSPNYHLLLRTSKGAGMLWGNAAIKSDGQVHTMTYDLRDSRHFKALGRLNSLSLGVQAAEKAPAEFDLLELAFEGPDDKPATTWPLAEPLSVQVVDESGQPVPGAKVSVDPDFVSTRAVDITDARGRVEINTVDHDGAYREIHVRAADLAPTSIHHTTGDTAPVRIKMLKAIHLAGRVVNEKDEPIPGVLVLGRISAPDDTALPEAHWRHHSRITAVTDENGAWRSGPVPHTVSDLKLMLRHPDYQTDKQFRNVNPGTVKAMLAGQAILTMGHGSTFAGRVIDAQGRPLEGAAVRLSRSVGLNTQGFDYAQLTGSNGEFNFTKLGPGLATLVVQAAKHRTYIQDLTPNDLAAPALIKLEETAGLFGTVIDEQGKPVAGLRVELNNLSHANLVKWKSRTDEKGQFHWPEAPDTVVGINFIDPKTDRINVEYLHPAESPHTINFFNVRTIHVTVTNAATGEPIKQFRAIPGVYQEEFGKSTSWQSHHIKQVQGKNTIDLAWDFDIGQPRVRVEASGFRPGESRVIGNDEQHPEIALALEPAKDRTGTILTPEGKPASEAKLHQATFRQTVYIHQILDHNFTSEGVPAAVTDKQGKFSIPPVDEDKYTWIIRHESGYLRMTDAAIQVALGPDAAPLSMRLEPWASIEGSIKVDGKAPDSRYLITVETNYRNDSDRPLARIEMSVGMKKDGSFHVPQAFGGPARITIKKSSLKQHGESRSKLVILEPGKTHQISFGDEGRPLIGKVRIENPRKGDKLNHTTVGLREYVTPPPYTPAAQRAYYLLEYPRDQAKARELAGLRALPDVKAWFRYMQASNNSPTLHLAYVGHDGTFHIDDVEPGEYELSVSSSYLAHPDDRVYGGIARLVVPESPDRKDLDVGEIVVGRTEDYRVSLGEIPPINHRTVDDEVFTVDRTDARIEVLVFWATWSKNSMDAIAFLNDLHARYKDEKNFALAGLSVDHDYDALLAAIKAHHIDWPQVHLGPYDPYDGTQLMVRMGIGPSELPAMLLVGSHGQLIARNLRGQSLINAIDQALANAAEGN